MCDVCMPVAGVRTSIEYMCVHTYAYCVHVWCGVCVYRWYVWVCAHLGTGPHTLSSLSLTASSLSRASSQLPAGWAVVSPTLLLSGDPAQKMAP